LKPDVLINLVAGKDSTKINQMENWRSWSEVKRILAFKDDLRGKSPLIKKIFDALLPSLWSTIATAAHMWNIL